MCSKESTSRVSSCRIVDIVMSIKSASDVCHFTVNFGPAKDPWTAGEEKMNKFVFIGQNLNRKELTESLMDCLYKDDMES